MDKSHEKAQETRRRNLEIKAELWREQLATLSAAKTALTKVMEMEDATPEQVLEAAKLLAELGRL